MAAKDSGSSVFQRGWAPGAVHRTVARSEGKTGCLACLGRSLWLVRLLIRDSNSHFTLASQVGTPSTPIADATQFCVEPTALSIPSSPERSVGGS